MLSDQLPTYSVDDEAAGESGRNVDLQVVESPRLGDAAKSSGEHNGQEVQFADHWRQDADTEFTSEKPKTHVQKAFHLGRRMVHVAGEIPKRHLRRVVRRPLCSLAVAQVFIFALCGAMFKEGALNTDFGAFLRANTGSSLNFDAYTHAWNTYIPPVESRRLQQNRHTNLIINYHHSKGGNLLEEQNLFGILKYERKLQALERWRFLCSVGLTDQDVNESDAQQVSCNPGESLVNYVWPSFPGSPGGPSVGRDSQQLLRLDGQGSLRLPVEAVLAALRDERSIFDRLERFLPKEFTVSDGGKPLFSDSLRSHFLFSQTLGPDFTFTSNFKAKQAVQDFFSTELHAALNEPDETMQQLGIRVFYSSSVLDKADIFDALWKDIQLSIGGLVLVFVMVRIHTQSWWLACMGCWLVLECIPLGYVVFKQISGLPDMSVVNSLATFVIIGVGSDLVFVLTDGWRQSTGPGAVMMEEPKNVTDHGDAKERADDELERHYRYMYNRLVWVYANAGRSCITTGLCAASSFLVNLMSVLLPLREFGLFMGLCCVFALFLQLALYPIAIIAGENRIFYRQQAEDGEEAQDDITSSAVVPCEPQPDSDHLAISAESERSISIRSRSIFVRCFEGCWSSFIIGHKLKIFTAFVVLFIVSIIGVAMSIKVDGGLPKIFPDDHNQVEGKKVIARFETAVKVAAATASHSAYLCGPAVPHGSPKDDALIGCGSYASVGYCEHPKYMRLMVDNCPRTCGFSKYCLASWCSVDSPPNISKEVPGVCECFEEGNDEEVSIDADQAEQAIPGIMSFETTIYGFDKERWPDLEPYLRPMHTEMAGAPGEGHGQWFSYRKSLADSPTWKDTPEQMQALPMPPLVQQHWRSGSLASWRSFKAPTFSVKTGISRDSLELSNDSERVVKQYCFCDGIMPCLSTSAKKRTVYHPFAGPGGSVWESVVDTSSKVQPGRRTQLTPIDTELLGEDLARPLLHESKQHDFSAEWPVSESYAHGELSRAHAWPQRRLASAGPRSTVYIVWGLKVRDLGPLDIFVETDKKQMWDLDLMFDPSDPWAQRAFISMTENLPEALQSKPSPKGKTWLKAYEEWLLMNDDEYPSRDFHTSSEQFLDSPRGKDFKDTVLRDEATGKLVAMRVPFEMAVGSGSGLAKSLDAKKAWDEHVEAKNAEASIRANQAFHVSGLWVSVEAQDGILRSTASTIVTSLLVGYLAAVSFTQDCVLSLFPILSVFLTVCSLLFIMVGVLQWEFGAVDVIALIVFLGYMFTFNLHVTQFYNHAKIPRDTFQEEELAEMDELKAGVHASPEAVARRWKRERENRVQFSMTSIGQSLLSSATTTSVCAAFLLACQLQFFLKFGVVILSVTGLSLLHSLIFLPAFLMICGPTSMSCRCARQLRQHLGNSGQRLFGRILGLKEVKAEELPLETVPLCSEPPETDDISKAPPLPPLPPPVSPPPPDPVKQEPLSPAHGTTAARLDLQNHLADSTSSAGGQGPRDLPVSYLEEEV